MVVPPLYMKTSDNQWEGFSIELWKAVAQNMRVQFEFREFPNVHGVVNALERGEIDIIPSLVVAEEKPGMSLSGQNTHFSRSG